MSRSFTRGAILTIVLIECIVILACFVTTLTSRSRSPTVAQLPHSKFETSIASPLWTTLTDKFDYFSVEVLGEVITQEKVLDDGRTTRLLSSYHMCNPDKDEDTLVFAAIYGTPPSDWQRITDDERFDGVENTITATGERKILSISAISLEQFPGKEYWIREPNNRTTIMRSYLVGDDSLVLSVGYMKELDVADSASRFFSSLRWLKR